MKKRTDIIKSLRALYPKTAVILDKYDKEKEIPVADLRIGDIFVVRPGEIVPVDGVVIEGSSAVNEAALTGKKAPVDKHIGSKVMAATTNNSGYLKCRATRVGEDTTLYRVIKLVSESMDSNASGNDRAAMISKILIPIELLFAVLTFVIWKLAGQTVIFSLLRAMTVLLISCPWILIPITKEVFRAGIGLGAKNGIFFRNLEILEKAEKVSVIALEKTGTITKGEPFVTDVFTPDSITRSGYSLINNSENELLRIAGLLERKSNHPLAKAVVDYVGDVNNYIEDLDEEGEDITDFEILPGYGLKAKYQDQEVVGASLKYISAYASLLPEVREKAVGLASQGKTPICFTKGKKLLGIIAVSDAVKDETKEAIKELKGMGLHSVMLTGDNVRTSMAIADQAGIDEVAAEILPDKKKDIINELSNNGMTAIVGDGSYDESLLDAADIGIAIGAFADVDKVSSDIVLMKNDLLDVSSAIRLSRLISQKLRRNLFVLTFYNIIAMIFGSGVLLLPLDRVVSPIAAVLINCIFILILYLNIYRLKSSNIYDQSKDYTMKDAISEEILNGL
ncbi:MAG: heavy metal translocating P-type ATPase [Butyrivibrio sp.]|nr:heavy metal translocating P-type ATPase [Butyrivibrio sp.]